MKRRGVSIVTATGLKAADAGAGTAGARSGHKDKKAKGKGTAKHRRASTAGGAKKRRKSG